MRARIHPTKVPVAMWWATDSVSVLAWVLVSESPLVSVLAWVLAWVSVWESGLVSALE